MKGRFEPGGKHSGEKGFTLIEMAVAVAILAIIAAGARMTAVQTIKVSQASRDHTVALRQADNVGYWVSKDLLMAQTANTTDNLGTADVEFVSIFWKDWETGDTHDIRYILTDSIDSLKEINRKQLTQDKDGLEIINKTTFVADYINTANVSLQDGLWILNVEAKSGDKSSSKVYKVSKRNEY